MPSPTEPRNDLGAFSIAVGRPLEPWQSESLSLAKRTSVLLSARQSGKSLSLFLLALWWAYRRPDQRVLIVSAGEAASKRLLGQAAEVARSSPLLSGSIVDETSGQIKLSNGSTLLSVPASERAIRGQSIDLLLLDECAQLADPLIYDAAIPTTAARPDARVVMASQAGDTAGAFYGFCESESESIEVSRWPLEACHWIPPEFIEQARETLPPAVFAREFLCIFGGTDEETLIPRQWIEEAQRRTLEPGPVVFGVDLAAGGDESVCIRLARGVARVVWSNREPDLMKTAGRIAATARDERGPAAPIWLDVGGLGHGVYDRCRELGLNVHPFTAGGRADNPERHLNRRAEAWMTVREALRLGDLDLDPGDKVLANQLASQRYGIASNGAIQIEAKTGSNSPDRADALCIALAAGVSRYRGEQVAKIAAEMRAEDRKGGPLRSAEEELAAEGGLTTEEMLGERRRGPSWREIRDSGFPEFR